MSSETTNGGFPEPPPGDPVKVVSSAHPECGAETRVRLSGYLPETVVRRVVCQGCGAPYPSAGAVAESGPEAAEDPASAWIPADDGDAGDAVDASAEAPPPAEPTGRRLRLPAMPSLPPASSRIWRWLGIPVAALIVAVALYVVQGGDEPSPNVVVPPSGAPAAGGAKPGEAQFVTQPGFSLALPPGWEQTTPTGGASFTAESLDGNADATLWIEEDRSLTLADFEARSLEQLRSLTGNADVVERIPAPTDAGTVVRLRADTPEGTGVSAPYEVTLRAAGPYRYYLATTVEPGAPPRAAEGADLIHSSFIPEPDGAGKIKTGKAPGGE